MSSFGLIKIVEFCWICLSLCLNHNLYSVCMFSVVFFLSCFFFFLFLSILRSQSQNIELDISKLKCVQSHPVPKVPTDISDNFHANVNDVIIQKVAVYFNIHGCLNNISYVAVFPASSHVSLSLHNFSGLNLNQLSLYYQILSLNIINTKISKYIS